MKALTTIGLVLLTSMSGLAQLGVPVFRGGGNAVVDGAGNLVVFDSGQSATGVTITGLRRSFFAPQTRITIQSPGTTGNVQTVIYDAEIQVIGTGTSAIYAIATVYTVSGTTFSTAQSLIAIKTGQSLPAAVSGFPSLALTAPTEARLGASDYIALLTETAPAAGTTTTTRVLTARVVHFNGNSFDVISSGTLP
jgi:hypothetical protein